MQCSVHKREKQRIEKCSNWTSHRPGVMAGGQQSAEPQTLECEADLSWDNELITAHGSAKATKIESSYLNEIPLQMSPKGMWGPENMKIKNFRWGLFEFYIFLY